MSGCYLNALGVLRRAGILEYQAPNALLGRNGLGLTIKGSAVGLMLCLSSVGTNSWVVCVGLGDRLLISLSAWESKSLRYPFSPQVAHCFMSFKVGGWRSRAKRACVVPRSGPLSLPTCYEEATLVQILPVAGLAASECGTGRWQVVTDAILAKH